MSAPDFLPVWPPGANAFLVLGLLLLAGLAGGRLAATTRVLPAITGYIATGFVLGPGVVGLLSDSVLAQSRVLAEFSLGLIVFDLGRRLDLSWARHDRWLLPIGIAESALSFVAMFAVLRLIGTIDMLEAAVAAMVGIATAPAVVLLVTNELKAEGPVTRRTLWHVALNNVIATLGITLLLPFIEARASGATWNPVARALWLIAGSFLLGYVAFVLMTLLARWLGKSAVPQFVLAVGIIVATVGAAQSARLSVLLALLVLGVCARNLDRRHRLVDVDFGRAAHVFFVALFVLTGATLRPDQFGAIAWVGLAFVVARLLGKTAALFALAWPAHISLRQAGTLALALTPIAGLAIGMTQPIYEVAPEFGARLAAIVVSGVAILHLLGPIATRYALIRAGEGEPGARD
ncbi:MAG TPA: cation:proton antiporter [Casimicrobiaceae bacterium]|nr:cation:proton antiporter [Casimicrobiaceae bacterium]